MTTPYAHVFLIDTEFRGGEGEKPIPVCVCWYDMVTGQWGRLWVDGVAAPIAPPFPIDDTTLFVAYYSSAEWGTFAALGWPMPTRVLDLFTEFRCRTNRNPIEGEPAPRASLLEALSYFQLPGIEAIDKESMRDLILEGPPYSEAQREAILDYCDSDVHALLVLMGAMAKSVDLPRALIRGREMVAAGRMEFTATPIDVEILEHLKAKWPDIQYGLVEDAERDLGAKVFEGLTFKEDLFEKMLIERGWAWPKKVNKRGNEKLALDRDTFKAMGELYRPEGHFDLSDDVFRQMVRIYQSVQVLRELRDEMSKLRLFKLSVGSDGRNRTLLSAFRAATSRFQPSNSKAIFGASTWLRGLIKPPVGWGICYIDYKTQEFGIAAALSGDLAMMEAYTSGDPYFRFAQLAAEIPADITIKMYNEDKVIKARFKPVRDKYKRTVLGLNYGMGQDTLVDYLGLDSSKKSDMFPEGTPYEPHVARSLIKANKRAFPQFWDWLEHTVSTASMRRYIETDLGWRMSICDPQNGKTFNPRTIMNFKMQAHGAEMTRLACAIATEASVPVCTPVHDAVLICSPLDRLDADIATARAAMSEASKVVLRGFEIGTDIKTVRWPDRYMDADRGLKMWNRVMARVGRPLYDKDTGHDQ
jgi:DNA polymerase I